MPDSDQVFPSSMLLMMTPPDPKAHISPSSASAVFRSPSIPVSTTSHPLLTSWADDPPDEKNRAIMANTKINSARLEPLRTGWVEDCDGMIPLRSLSLEDLV